MIIKQYLMVVVVHIAVHTIYVDVTNLALGLSININTHSMNKCTTITKSAYLTISINSRKHSVDIQKIKCLL